MTEEFYIGQIFGNTYPSEAAEFCNNRGNCYIDEIESLDGVRRFEIKVVSAPTESELKAARVAEIKQQLRVLDEQRIRAIAEPSIKDEETGETWLEFYNKQIFDLRDELNTLL